MISERRIAEMMLELEELVLNGMIDRQSIVDQRVRVESARVLVEKYVKKEAGAHDDIL